MRQRLAPATIALALLTVGCVGPAAPSSTTDAAATGAAPVLAMTDLPPIDGSTANIPLISLTIQRLTGMSAEVADNAVKTSGTPTAWENLIEKSVDVLVVYEADAQVQQDIRDSGIELEVHPIGRDALVFFANASNPVTSLTTAQYKAIYTGRTTNWSQVGGKDAKIVAYQRPEKSGSQTLLRSHVVGTATLAKAPTDRVTGDMAQIVTDVASYANRGNALGYSVYYYLANMYDVEGIKMLGADGVLPSKVTIAEGTYPYSNDFYVVIRAEEPAGSPARTVMNWLLGAEGQQAVADAGYVPIRR